MAIYHAVRFSYFDFHSRHESTALSLHTLPPYRQFDMESFIGVPAVCVFPHIVLQSVMFI